MIRRFVAAVPSGGGDNRAPMDCGRRALLRCLPGGRPREQAATTLQSSWRRSRAFELERSSRSQVHTAPPPRHARRPARHLRAVCVRRRTTRSLRPWASCASLTILTDPHASARSSFASPSLDHLRGAGRAVACCWSRLCCPRSRSPSTWQGAAGQRRSCACLRHPRGSCRPHGPPSAAARSGCSCGGVATTTASAAAVLRGSGVTRGRCARSARLSATWRRCSSSAPRHAPPHARSCYVCGLGFPTHWAGSHRVSSPGTPNTVTLTTCRPTGP